MRPDSPWAVAAVIAVLVAVGVGVDALELSGAGAPETSADELATAGAWFCAAGDSAAGGRLHAVLAAPPGTSDHPADTAVTVFHGGERTRVESPSLAPGRALVREVPGGLEHPGVATRWWRWPAVTTRLWRPSGDGSSSRLVAGPCQHGPSARWVIPGMATAGGATAEVVLANPYDTDAAVQLAVATPQGLRQPRLLENIAVPARSTKTIPINEHAPAETDLGVVVTTRTGRIIAEGVQRLDAAIGGVDGSSLAAGGRPATRWTIPWYRSAGDQADSWLWVTNPSQQPAAVSVTVHTSERGSVGDAVGETSVAPGQVRRIDLRNLVNAGEAGVTVVSENGVPVVASAATRLDEGGEERTAFAVQLGAPAADPSWVLSFASGQDRRAFAQLVNPTSQAARIDLALWAQGELRRPESLQGVEVPPGSSLTINLNRHLPDVSTATAYVTAPEGRVVAGVTSDRSSGPLDLSAYVGVPGASWRGAGTVPDVRHEPHLTGRIGTTPGPTASPRPPPAADVAPTSSPPG